MSNRELALYTGSNSTFNLGETPQSVNPTLENTYVRKEACAVTMAPLAVMPPLHSGASNGTSGRSMARTKAPHAYAHSRWAHPSRSASETATKSVRVTPLGNTIYSYSYTIVGVQKSDGRCGKGLMHKT